MTTDSTAESRARNSVLAEWCQWHYLSITLGKVYGLPTVCPVWVITSAVPESVINAVAGGEKLFSQAHEKSIAALKREAEELKAVQATIRNGYRPGQTPKESLFTPAQAERLRKIQELLAQTVTVNYRNPEADRSSIIEMLKRSKFRSMAYVDEIGSRAVRYTMHENSASHAIGKDMALLSLLRANSAEMVFIRSSTSGGSNIISQLDDSQAAFSLMTLADEDILNAMAPRLRKPYAAPCKGRTFVCPVEPRAQIGLVESHVFDVLRKSYATLHEGDYLQITTDDEQAWVHGLPTSLSDFVPSDDLQLLARVQNIRPLLDIKHIAGMAFRAAVTQAAYEQAHKLDLPSEKESDVLPENDRKRTIRLEAKHLEKAKAWAHAIFRMAYELDKVDAMLEGAAGARSALASKRDATIKAELESIAASLASAITERPDSMLSHTQAVKVHKIPPAHLKAVVDAYPERFIALNDVKLEGVQRKVSVAYAFRRDFDEVESDEPSETVYGSGERAAMISFWKDLQEQAVDHRVDAAWEHRPVVNPWEFDDLHQKWIKSMREDPDIARTTALVPSGPVPEGCETGARLLQLWFRYDPDGKEMCDWTKCHLKWGMAKRWEEKDQDQPDY